MSQIANDFKSAKERHSLAGFDQKDVMQKNLSIFTNGNFDGGSCSHSSQSTIKFLRRGIVLILTLQLLAATTDAGSTANENSKFGAPAAETPGALQDIREIKPGETIEGSLNRGEKISYKIKLEAGQSALIQLITNSMQMTLRSYAPDGAVQSASETANANLPFEDLIVVAEQSGYYRVEASCYRPVTFSIRLKPPHETTEADRQYLSALKLSQDSIELFEDRSLTGKQKWSKALEIFEEKLSIYQRLGDRKLIAITHRDLGYICRDLGELSKSVHHFTESVELLKTLDDVDEKNRFILDASYTLSALGSIYRLMGNYQKALDYNYQSLNSSRSKSNEYLKDSEAITLNSIGVIYHLIADEQRALEFYERSLAVRRAINPPSELNWLNQGINLCNIGNLYRGIGADELVLDYFNSKTPSDRLKAIEYYRQALEISRSIKNKGLEAFVLLKIGNSNKELGNFSEAEIHLNQSLEIFKNPSKDRFNVLRSLGNLYLVKGEFQKSLPYYEQAIALLQKLNNNNPEFINTIAKDYFAGGETSKALELYNQALALSYERSQPEISAAALYEIARIERDRGNFANARSKIEEAVQTVESIRAKIAAEDVQATYFATVKRYYDFYIDLLMQAHKSQPEKAFDILALQTSEKSRSRSLLDLLTVAKVDVKQGVDPLLLERERQARARMIEKAYQQNRLVLGKHTKEETEKIQREIATLTGEYQAVQTEIKNKSPRYAALTQPAPLTASQIQQLLDSGTLLLEYSLGEKKSYLWAVSSNSIASFDLPAREEIETRARKIYELLTIRNQNLKNETNGQKRARVKAAEEEYPKAAAELSRMLLGPAAPLLENKRLLIVPDGALSYIPFSALPSPKDAESGNLRRPLGTRHEILTLPSASILGLLRQEIANRKPAPRMLAVFADPVFNQNDVRSDSAAFLSNRASAKKTSEISQPDGKTTRLFTNRDFERAVSETGLISGQSAGLPRLPFSRREADSIFKVSPKNLSLKEVDFEASKASVFSSNLEQYRILHFATHGLLNSRHPELSGVILSLVDKNGGEIDGFLRLQDIYNLKLSADLVVLSACNTALGKDIKGEGLIGLTRGFMYSGAPRVIASLWKVDDAATAELMSIFYRKMLVENLRPAAALRAAQTEMIKQPRWKSPYYWAAFTIQGEWK